MDQNELNHVIAQANEVVEQAILQHPDAPQVSDSVSFEALEFFKAQGAPITLELPLTDNSSAIVPYLNNGMDPESDYSVRNLANNLGLHPGIGPSPSIQMLIQELLERAAAYHHDMYIPRPISTGLASFEGLKLKWAAIQLPLQEKYPGYFVDSDDEIIALDPFWGNNLEASSSTAPPPMLSLEWPAKHLYKEVSDTQPSLEDTLSLMAMDSNLQASQENFTNQATGLSIIQSQDVVMQQDQEVVMQQGQDVVLHHSQEHSTTQAVELFINQGQDLVM